MSTVKANRVQFGQSGTATQNFTVTAEAADGSMKLARGVAGATTQDILTVAASGQVSALITPPQFDVGASLATTDFVQRALGNLSGLVIITDTISLTAAHCGVQLVGNTGLSGKTITLPPVGGLGLGATIHFSAGSNATPLTIAASGAETIAPGLEGSGTITSFEMDALDSVVLVNIGTGWRMVGGSQMSRHSVQFAAVQSVNGYQRLPSGVIMQWGQATTNASGVGAVTFPIAFPTMVRSINANYMGATTATGAYVCSCGGLTATGFNAYLTTISGNVGIGTTGGYAWQAVGY